MLISDRFYKKSGEIVAIKMIDLEGVNFSFFITNDRLKMH